MKGLIKLAGLAIGAGAVAWLMKDRLVPAPEGPATDPPAFRVAPEPSAPAEDEPGPVDDLSEVKGIGPVYSGRLAEAGITTFAGLAGADAADGAEATGVTEDQAADWIAQASGLAAGA